MYDQMAKEIDAVIITTPDHTHFAATMIAMELGMHVYVEKPLGSQCLAIANFKKSSAILQYSFANGEPRTYHKRNKIN